jgi:hypothetical protein
MEQTVEASRLVAALTGRLVQLAGEIDRREGWRGEGSTSLEAWIAERTGVALTTARTQARVAQRLFDLPNLAAALSSGDVSFDKVRTVVDSATPETDAEIATRAADHSVRELAELARSAGRPSTATGELDWERRSLRFNDTFRTVTAQLPPDSYAEVRTVLEGRARELPSDGETPWDRRLADSLMSLVRSSGRAKSGAPYTLVAHVPLSSLLDEGSGPELCGELERDGFIDAETVRRLACDATFVVAVDDESGHTMYEGRQRRYPTAAQRREIMRRDRHCRFPGCSNVTFAHPHHVRRWKPDRGPTDLPNLALLCDYHHHLVHSNAWTLSGDANAELTFVGPTGRVMVSRPSPLWTAVTEPSTSTS